MSQGPTETAAPELVAALRAIMERSPVPMAELEGAAHIVRYANPAFCNLAGVSSEMLVGKPFAETMREKDTCLTVLDRVYRTGDAETHAEPEHSGPHPPYWSYAMWPVLDGQQHPVGVIVQVTDTTRSHQQAAALNEALLISSVRQHEQTEAAERSNDQLRGEIIERKRMEQALRVSEARLGLILDSATEYAIIALDQDGRIASWNRGAERLLGYREAEALGREGGIFFSSAARANREPEKEMRQARTQGRAANERWHLRKDGSRFWGSGVMLPMKDGEASGYLKIFRDRTRERQAEERQALLIGELNHRVKNTLATVLSIASQTFRKTESPDTFMDALQTRIFAMSRAHDLLTREAWEGADLAEVARAALAPWLEDGRISLSGPLVRLRAPHALALSMAMNELATNAVKYGALSASAGRVALTWRHDDLLEIEWNESGGPRVSPPERQGFGSRVLTRALAVELGGNVDLRLQPEGASCLIRFDPGEQPGRPP